MAQSTLRVVEGGGMDKTKALDAALSQIERAFGKGSIMRLGKGGKPIEGCMALPGRDVARHSNLRLRAGL